MTDNTRTLAHVGDDEAFIERLKHAVPRLPSQTNESLARRLQSGLPKLRGGAGYFCAPLQEFAGGALVPVDAPWFADAQRDIGSGQGCAAAGSEG